MSEGGIFVYVSHQERGGRDEGEIRVLRLHSESGELTPVQQVPVAGKTMPMTLSSDRRFLYVAIRSRPYRVASYAMDALSGRLTHLSDAPLPESMAYISTDRTGRYLFGAAIFQESAEATVTSLISVSAIGPDGFVQPPHQVVRTEPKAHAILADPSNRYVLVTCCDADVIRRQIFDAVTGTFSPDALPPVHVKHGAGPRHFVFHPNRKRVYMVTEPGAWIYVYDYDAHRGGLNELQIVSAGKPGFDEKAPHGADLHITPDGRFLYASERASHTLAAFRIDSVSGLLDYIGHYATERYPRSFAIDPWGRYLLAAGHMSHCMSVYAIDRDSGVLAMLKQYPMGKGPNWVEIVRLP